MKKLKDQKGFTLTEMLFCVVTLLLLAGVCSMGTDMALNSYNRSLYESNSQMLESTLNTYLSDIVRHATFEVDADQKVKTVTNSMYKLKKGRIGVSDDGRIYLYKDERDTTGVSLLSENVYTKALKIEGFELRYDKDEDGEYITVFYKIESTVLDGVAKECDFKYRIATIY